MQYVLCFAKMLFVNKQRVSLISCKGTSVDIMAHVHFILVLLRMLVQDLNKHFYESNNKRFYSFIMQYSRNLYYGFSTPSVKLSSY
jgi:hypothetical protein